MSVLFSISLNDTIDDPSFTIASVQSLSFRFENMQPGTYIEIDGISWGLTTRLGQSTSNVSGVLSIIRNEVFDPAFDYGNISILPFVTSTKDVVFRDNVSQFHKARNIDFGVPFQLKGSSNYLIVASGFTDPDALAPPGNVVSAWLSVRGKLIDLQASDIALKPR